MKKAFSILLSKSLFIIAIPALCVFVVDAQSQSNSFFNNNNTNNSNNSNNYGSSNYNQSNQNNS
ncbi:hypothetical protein K8I31_02595, partial [bacterium]|nr:hypothetical protein [bacterium]